MRTTSILLFSLLTIQFALAQDPMWDGMNYQAIVRDANGDPLPNQTIGMQFVIAAGLSQLYIEDQQLTTNDQGLISVVVGTGTVTGGTAATWADIDWSLQSTYGFSSYMDISGGTNYQLIGYEILRAVPYAQRARTADSLTTGTHWELLGNELQNTNAGVVAVQGDQTVGGDVYIDGGISVGQAVNFPTWDISGQTGSLTFNEQFQGTRMAIEPGGNIGVGTEFPDTTLHIVGALKLKDGNEGNGKVLTSDADGLASWQNLAGGSGQWLTNGNDIYAGNTGNVGIGIPNPQYPLHIIGDKVTLQNTGQSNGTAYMDFESTTAGGSELTIGVVGGSGDGIVYQRSNQPLLFGTNDQLRMKIAEGGNVGIGTSSPGHLLDVRGNMRLGNGSSAEQDIEFVNGTGSWQVGSNNVGNGTSGNQFYIFDSYSNLYSLTVQRGTGNVGIGITTPQSKLAVNGKITCKEVEVTLSGFPDYVFELDYDLMTLEEIEVYIKAHGHLPNVPSASEVEENGLGLGEMNKILLEKVEELTLHAIDSEKRIRELEELLKRVSALESALDQE